MSAGHCSHVVDVGSSGEVGGKDFGVEDTQRVIRVWGGGGRGGSCRRSGCAGGPGAWCVDTGGAAERRDGESVGDEFGMVRTATWALLEILLNSAGYHRRDGELGGDAVLRLPIGEGDKHKVQDREIKPVWRR